MSESFLAQGSWAEDGDSDTDTKPLPPSPEVESHKVLPSSSTSGTEQLNDQEDYSLNGDDRLRCSQSSRGDYYSSSDPGKQYQTPRHQQHHSNRGGDGGGNLRRGGGETNIPIPECPPFKAFISNLPPDVDARFLKDRLFHGYQLLDIHIPITRRGSGGNPDSRFAYVEFLDQASLREALRQDGTPIYGRNIRVSVAQLRAGEHRQQQKPEFGQHVAGRDNLQPRDSHLPPGGRDQVPRLVKENSAPVLSSSSAATAVTGGRKKLVLHPRSKPKKDTTSSISETTSNSSIFGGGKPRDERLYKAEKKNGNKEERQPIRLKPVEKRTTKSPPLKQPVVQPTQIQSRKTPVTGPENKKEKE
eukprot:482854_1